MTALTIIAVGRSTLSLVEGMRPRQWTKNLIAYGGLIFAGGSTEAERWGQATLMVVALCLLSSAAYLLNDVRDADADRQHPLKRARPVARGALSPHLALAGSALCALAGLSVSGLLNSTSLQFAAVFLVGQLAYTLSLKRVPVADVLVIASLFVLRAAAGAEAVDVSISIWLLICTAVLATFLGLAKRRAELVLVAGGATPGRSALRGYSLPLLDTALFAAAAATALSYVAYAVDYSPHASWMAVTVPFVVFGVARYLWLVRRRDLGEEPENVLLTDRVLLTTIVFWAIAAAFVVAYR